MATTKPKQRDGWADLPTGYFAKVKQLQQRLNREALQISGATSDHGNYVRREVQDRFIKDVDDHGLKQAGLLSLRELAAHIRSDGYGIGYVDDVYDPASSIDDGIKRSNPYPMGSGAGECWIRGYCQGRSRKTVVDPKQYLEAHA